MEGWWYAAARPVPRSVRRTVASVLDGAGDGVELLGAATRPRNASWVGGRLGNFASHSQKFRRRDPKRRKKDLLGAPTSGDALSPADKITHEASREIWEPICGSTIRRTVLPSVHQSLSPRLNIDACIFFSVFHTFR